MHVLNTSLCVSCMTSYLVLDNNGVNLFDFQF